MNNDLFFSEDVYNVSRFYNIIIHYYTFLYIIVDTDTEVS